MTVISKSARRINFMTELPFDIVQQILCHCNTQELLCLLTVSKTWKTLLVNSHDNFYATIVFRDKQCITGLATIAHHVKQLDLINKKSLRDIRETMHSMQKRMFMTLASLTLVNTVVPDVHFMIQAFKAVANTLKYLRMEKLFSSNMARDTVKIPFGSIVGTCRHLEQLSCDTSITIFANSGSQKKTRTLSSLKNLELNHYRVLPGNEVKLVLQQCQNLRRLSIAPCERPALSMIWQCLQNNLEYLSFNMPIFENEMFPSTLYSSPNTCCIVPTQTLQAISVPAAEIQQKKKKCTTTDNTSFPAELTYLALYLQHPSDLIIYLLHEQYATTLTELHIRVDSVTFIYGGETTILRAFENKNIFKEALVNIQAITICNSDTLPQTTIVKLLLYAASKTTLQKLHLISTNLSSDPDLFPMIKEFISLKSLYLRGNIKASDEDVVSLIQHYATISTTVYPSYFLDKKQQHHLESIWLSGSRDIRIDDTMLKELAKIQTLQEIIIQEAYRVTEQGLIDFSRALQHHPCLRYIQFYDTNAITLEAILPLALIASLEHMIIYSTHAKSVKVTYQELADVFPTNISLLIQSKYT